MSISTFHYVTLYAVVLLIVCVVNVLEFKMYALYFEASLVV